MGGKIKTVYILKAASRNRAVMFQFKGFLKDEYLQLQIIKSPALAAQTKRNNSSWFEMF